MYTAITTLLKIGWTISTKAPLGSDPRRKMYAITASEHAVLEGETARLEAMAANARNIFDSERGHHP
ncbi:MAG: hypothetical protein M0Z53_14490 [Thermaerobacter sp.]|nr:hypothetical protein [Thermaerobacter sp.]